MALNCNGYGSAHGAAKGRLWFACGKCRWSRPAPAPVSLEQAQAMLAALPRDLAGEALEAQGLSPHG